MLGDVRQWKEHRKPKENRRWVVSLEGVESLRGNMVQKEIATLKYVKSSESSSSASPSAMFRGPMGCYRQSFCSPETQIGREDFVGFGDVVVVPKKELGG